MMKKVIIFFVLFATVSFVIFSEDEKEFSLPEIIGIGIKNNPGLLAKQRETEAKRAAYEAAKPLFNPELEIHMGQGRSHDTSITRRTDGVSVSQSIENPMKRKYRLQSFEKDWQASLHLFEFARLEVITEVKCQFHRILLLDRQQELARKNLDSLREIQQLITKRVELGEVKELESIKLDVEALRAQNELQKIRTELKLAHENLNKLLGNALPAEYRLSGDFMYSSLDLEEAHLIQTAVQSHPLVKNKERELELAGSNLSYVKWQRLPDPKLSGFIQNEIDGQNKGVGLSLEIPLWNFQTRAAAEAQSLVLKAEEELKAVRMELAAEVRAKLSQLKLSEQVIQLYTGGLLKQAEASLKIAEVSYKEGEISLIDYLDSQRTYFSILKDYYDSLYDWNMDKALLEMSIGEEVE